MQVSNTYLEMALDELEYLREENSALKEENERYLEYIKLVEKTLKEMKELLNNDNKGDS